MPNLPLTGLALLAAFATGAGLGYKWRDNTAHLQQAQWQRQQAQALADAQTKARQREQALQTQMERIQHDANDRLEALAAAERAAADNRVRDLARQFAARKPASPAAPAASCTSAETRARVLADLLGELDELAAVFAAEADRRMIAGKACEVAYRLPKK